MARRARKRYVVRLHPIVLQQITDIAERQGFLPATFMSNILETYLPENPSDYRIYDTEGYFQLQRGPGGEGAKQQSIYLSDKSYDIIAKISDYLVKNVDRKMTATFVIRDVFTKWLDENED